MNLKNVILYLSIYLFIGLFFLYKGLESDMFLYKNEYFFILISYFLVEGVYLGFILNHKNDIFHPVHLVNAIYAFIFLFTPMILILEKRTLCCGVDVMSGCIKATLVYVFSVISFFIGYFTTHINSPYKLPDINFSYDRRVMLRISIFVWMFFFILIVFHMLSSGYSFEYIFSLGLKGIVYKNAKSEYGFLSNFSIAIILPSLFIFYYSKNIFIKYIPLLLTLDIIYMRGFRIFALFIFFSIFIIYYRRRKQMPGYREILCFIFFVLIVFSYMGTARDGIRSGENINLDSENNSINYTLESNFNIYQPFYAIVQNYPDKYSYTLGESMIVESLEMWIPRALWDGKTRAVDATVARAVRNSVNDFAILGAAMAIPNIGEYYLEFGWIGPIVILYVIGVLCKKILRFYYSEKIEYILLYSVLLPSIMQISIRGYTPGLAPWFIFLFLGYFLMKLLYYINGKIAK